MPVSLYLGTVIAVIWDFDQTLIPGYQQEPLFAEYRVDPKEFWPEVGGLVEHYQKQGIVASKDTIYLNHILTYVKEGRFPGLTNAKLRQLGAQLKFYPGLPDFLAIAKERVEGRTEFSAHGITVEHYIVSTGLRQMILGSSIAKYVTDIWACDFIEEAAPSGYLKQQGKLKIDEHEISQVGSLLDNTTKTRAIWEINKGVNKNQIGVNDLIAPEDRRVPIRNMIFVADGPTDIPVFSILNSNGGRTLGIYNPAQREHFREVKRLSDQGRVKHFARADYEPGSDAAEWILTSIDEIAQAIVDDRQRLLHEKVGPSATHVV
jgi:hypothetical protein